MRLTDLESTEAEHYVSGVSNYPQSDLLQTKDIHFFQKACDLLFTDMLTKHAVVIFISNIKEV